MDILLQDLRGALRLLARNPVFTVVTVLTLGLGIGANTAIFSVLHAVLLRPLPFAEPEELVWIEQHAAGHGTAFEFSYPDYEDLREASRSFSGLAAAGNVRRFLHDVGAEARPVRGALVSADLFDVLDEQPLIGRRLVSEDGMTGAERVVVLGYEFWQRRFGGERSVLGAPIRLDGLDYTVVGIMPSGFEYPQNAELWVAVELVAAEWVDVRGIGFLHVVGRLAPAVTPGEAQAEVTGALRQLPGRESGPLADATATVTPLRDELVGPVRPALLLLLAGAGLVLLIACANVASMLLARGTTRRHEVSVRAALGASRARLIRQHLTESLVMATLGAGVGVGLARLAMEPLVRLSPIELYRGGSIEIVPVVLMFAAVLSIMTAIGFGIIPALRGTRTAGAGALAAGAGRTTNSVDEQRLINGLVVGEIALAFTLIIAAGLLVRSYGELHGVDLGFERDGRMTVEVFVPPASEPQSERNLDFFDELTRRVAALPGVRSAAGILLRPLEGPEGHNAPFTVAGQTADEQVRNPFMNYQAVTPGYFETIGIPLLGGRDFDDRDGDAGSSVVIVSRVLAERYWPGEDPVGQRMKLGAPDSPAPWMTVVGVVGEARYRGLEEVSFNAYLPHRQSGQPLHHLVVRTEAEPGAVVGPIRQEIRAIDPGARAVDFATIDELVDGIMARPRFHTALIGLFAMLALVLGAVGTYGVLAFAVSRRSREFAIRLAVGATAADLLGRVMRRALALCLLGIGIGLLGTFATTRALSGLLFGVSTLDPSVYLAGTLLVLATAAAAAGVPAWRAARNDPSATLRDS